jgi:hypothetical protein
MSDIKEHGSVTATPDTHSVEKRDIVDKDIATIERVMSPEMEKNFMNYDRVDAEVAKCQ